MKYLYYLLVFGLFIIMSSCQKRPTIPGEEDFVNHPILWENNLPVNVDLSPLSVLSPIIDEEGNSYIFLSGDYYDFDYSMPDSMSIFLFSFDKNGEKRWEKEIKIWTTMRTDFCYTNNRIIFYINENNFENNSFFSTLYILNSETGETIFQNEIENEIKGIAASENRIYYLNENVMYCLNLDGNELWNKTGISANEIMAVDNNIYTAGVSLIQYSDNEDECIVNWEWNAPNDSHPRIKEVRKDGELIVRTNNIFYFISDGGITQETIGSFSGSAYRNFKGLTQGGNFLFEQTDLYQYDSEGKEMWHTESIESPIKPIFCDYELAMAQNGNIYTASEFGIYVYDSMGKLDWHIGLYQEITNVFNPTLTSEGNILVISRGRLLCIKGDNSPPMKE